MQLPESPELSHGHYAAHSVIASEVREAIAWELNMRLTDSSHLLSTTDRKMKAQ